MANGIVIDFDKTLFIQFAVFVIFGIIIQKLIVNPVVDILDKRENATLGAKDDSKEMYEEAEKIMAEYETKIRDAQKEAAKEQEEYISQINKKLYAEFDSEREKISKKISEFNEKLENEKKEIKKELERESRIIAELIVKKIVG